VVGKGKWVYDKGKGIEPSREARSKNRGNRYSEGDVSSFVMSKADSVRSHTGGRAFPHVLGKKRNSSTEGGGGHIVFPGGARIKKKEKKEEE